jgi:LysM domain-containing protein
MPGALDREKPMSIPDLTPERSTETMSSISSVQSSWTPIGGQDQPQPPNPQQMLQPVATLLGTTTQSLMSEIQSGQTLSSIASSQGISQSSLISAIEKGLQNAAPQGSSQNAPSQTDLTTIAQNIANGTMPIGAHHHHRGLGEPSNSTSSNQDDNSGSDSSTTGNSSTTASSEFSALATALGLDPDSLLQSLTSGETLTSIASAQGVSSSNLQSILSSGLQIDTTA